MWHILTGQGTDRADGHIIAGAEDRKGWDFVWMKGSGCFLFLRMHELTISSSTIHLPPLFFLVRQTSSTGRTSPVEGQAPAGRGLATPTGHAAGSPGWKKARRPGGGHGTTAREWEGESGRRRERERDWARALSGATGRALQGERRRGTPAMEPLRRGRGHRSCSANGNGEQCTGKETHLVTAILHSCDLDLGRDEGLCDGGECIYRKERMQKAVVKFVACCVLAERKRRSRDELRDTV
jgi:hypothetical protein